MNRLAEAERAHARALLLLAELVADVLDEHQPLGSIRADIFESFVELGLDDDGLLTRLENGGAG